MRYYFHNETLDAANERPLQDDSDIDWIPKLPIFDSAEMRRIFEFVVAQNAAAGWSLEHTIVAWPSDNSESVRLVGGEVAVDEVPGCSYYNGHAEVEDMVVYLRHMKAKGAWLSPAQEELLEAAEEA